MSNWQQEYDSYQTPTFRAYARWKGEGRPGIFRLFKLIAEEEKVERDRGRQ